MEQARLTRRATRNGGFQNFETKNRVRVMTALEINTKSIAPVNFAKKWLACLHATRVILREGKQFSAYTESFPSMEAFRKNFRECIYGPSDRSTWDMPLGDIVLLPPLTPRPSGRPKIKRMRKEELKRPKRSFRSSTCQKQGHLCRT